MSIASKTVLASRPAAMVLALTLVAALTAPAVMLSRLHAAPTPPPTLPCAEINNNGCTELSATPPQDTVSVPPNIVLMLDDSGSMAWDYMPDWDYLANTSLDGVRNAGINDIYYNPDTVYGAPPRADGSLYPDSPGLTGAYNDGFTDDGAVDVTNYSASSAVDNGTPFRYWENLATTQVTYTDHDYGPAVWGGGSPGSPGSPGGCPNNYYPDPHDSSQCIRDPVPPTTTPGYWKCNSGDGNPYKDHGVYMCHHYVWEENRHVDHPYPATWVPPVTKCPSGSGPNPAADGLCHYPPVPVIPPTPPTPPTPDYEWICPKGGTTDPKAPPPPSTAPECTSQSGSRKYVHAFTYVVGTPVQKNEHYVIPRTPDAPSAGWCSVLYYAWQKNNCVNADDTSGTAAPTTNPDGTPALAQDGTALTAGQNIANWFSYYRTRLLMSKSGLMKAFSKLDAKYRFGFASINANGVSNIPSSPAPYGFDDSSSNGGGNSSNQLAVVQPFGAGSSGCPNLPGGNTCSPQSQKDRFWIWIANESANNGTPLRKALQAVGQYYQTAQPWSTMSSDPGYTAGSGTKFACRASYAILTTDGFWNGDDPSGIGYAAGTNGPVNSVPSSDTTTQYLAVPPFSGGGVGGNVPSLADVATYYWETDLQPDPVNFPNEVSTSTSDPAAWQHMTTFTIGLGFKPAGITPGSVCDPASDKNCASIFTWANGGSPITGFSWPTPASNSIYNIADLAHAAVNGHGDFFNVTKPTDLADALAKAFSDIAARTNLSPAAAVNASVLSAGALSFTTGYETKTWSGTFQAVTLNADGSAGSTEWDAGASLNTAYHSAGTYSTRNVWTDAYGPPASPVFSAFQFTAANEAKLDSTETAGLGGNTDCTGSGDTICSRIDYLLGDPTNEGGLYRARTSGILGAIIRSDPVYVSGATAGYYDTWPAGSPEDATGAQTYDAFVTQQSTPTLGTVYVGANDGMLHAFDAPVPTDCVYSGTPPVSSCNYNPDGAAGSERWAFIPRAVYANLGNLTDADFHFLPTVNETPVTRDVFFGQTSEAPTDNKWHTILAGGVGLGGRGVYALDITNPASFSASNVLWEFDSDSSVAGCTSIVGTAQTGSCNASDLGFTISQPNIGRINYKNKWVVLVSNGYFPDCTTPDIPTATLASCQAMAQQAPGYDPTNPNSPPYSALFVLDAETGSVIAELKTPSTVNGSPVTSFGLATPVMGDYLGNQVDTVAFAGDVEGNLWRFDISDPTSPSNWTVTLVYKAAVPGAQPITTMPSLFPDPTTGRFMVVFGTGKFLGVGDNSDDTVQAIYGVRDVLGTTWTQAKLTQQYLHEQTLTSGPNTGVSVRCVTGSASDGSCTSSPTPINAVSAASGGWFIDLHTTTSDGTTNDAGERVVASPAPIFASNAVVFETLITGAQNTDACDPSTQGAVLALNVLSGGTSGVSSLGGGLIAGARISNARTSGSVALMSQLGGVQALFAGSSLSGYPSGAGPAAGADQPALRRRSWNEINQNP